MNFDLELQLTMSIKKESTEKEEEWKVKTKHV